MRFKWVNNQLRYGNEYLDFCMAIYNFEYIVYEDEKLTFLQEGVYYKKILSENDFKSFAIVLISGILI